MGIPYPITTSIWYSFTLSIAFTHVPSTDFRLQSVFELLFLHDSGSLL